MIFISKIYYRQGSKTFADASQNQRWGKNGIFKYDV